MALRSLYSAFFSSNGSAIALTVFVSSTVFVPHQSFWVAVQPRQNLPDYRRGLFLWFVDNHGHTSEHCSATAAIAAASNCLILLVWIKQPSSANPVALEQCWGRVMKGGTDGTDTWSPSTSIPTPPFPSLCLNRPSSPMQALPNLSGQDGRG